MKKIILLLSLISFTNSAFSQWSAVEESDNGGYFVMTKSLKFSNSYLAVHMHPDTQCSPVFQKLFAPTDAPSDADTTEVLVRARVDKNEVQYIAGQAHISNGIVIYNWDGSDMLGQLIEGSMFIFDDGDSNSAMHTDRFNLFGSKYAINSLYELCVDAESWGESSGDEWSASFIYGNMFGGDV